ncbi:MAG: hypothetical protein CL780_02275 [Chloroflexi bacterium]|nr:hypothetical protein [Chloroflexota bacterium]
MDEIAIALIGLQDLDMILSKKKNQYLKISRTLDLGGGVSKLKNDVDKLKRETLKSQLEVSKMESDITDLESKSSELQQKLYGGSITNMRELTAVEAEYNSIKNNVEEINRKRNLAKDLVSTTTEAFINLSEELKIREVEWIKDKKNLQKEKSKLGKNYNSHLKNRSQFTDKIPDKIMRDYIRLFKSNNGVAIVKVNKGICQGCLVRLPIGDLNKMKSTDHPVLCNSGRHFLTD